MNNQQINGKFAKLSTPLIADACLRLNIPLRLAPSGIHPLSIENHIAGQALPVRHYGSVDIFPEAMGTADSGDILVIDNKGKMDVGPPSLAMGRIPQVSNDSIHVISKR